MARQVERNVGARLFAVCVALRIGIEDDHVHHIRTAQQRNRGSDGACGTDAGIPCDEGALAEGAEVADIGHHQHRAAGIEHHVFREVGHGSGIRIVEVGLADDHEVGVARLQADAGAGFVVDEARFIGAHFREAHHLFERLQGFLALLAQHVHVRFEVGGVGSAVAQHAGLIDVA